MYLQCVIIRSGDGLVPKKSSAITWTNDEPIDQSKKSHNALVPYHTRHRSEQKCTHLCSECCIVGYAQVWDLWDWSIHWRLQTLPEEYFNVVKMSS